MQITRRMPLWQCEAVFVDADGTLRKVVTDAVIMPHMRKTIARAELAKAYGGKIPYGAKVDWVRLGSVTMAMTVEDFIDHAVVIATEEN